MNKIIPDNITERILPIIWAFVNCEVKLYRNIRIKNALTAIRYFIGRISSFNILKIKSEVTTSCIRTIISPISVAQPLLFRRLSFLESVSFFLKRYFISSLLLVKKLDIIHPLITLEYKNNKYILPWFNRKVKLNYLKQEKQHTLDIGLF